jgi:hypothetical protein
METKLLGDSGGALHDAAERPQGLFYLAEQAASHRPNWPDGWPIGRTKWRDAAPSWPRHSASLGS